jgi:hypothetical protein
MPRLSYRAHAIAALLSTYQQATQLFVADNLQHLIDSDSHELDENNEKFLLAARLHHRLHKLQNSRYIIERRCRKHSLNMFKEDLRMDQGRDSWLSLGGAMPNLSSKRIGLAPKWVSFIRLHI